jgi:hypothetical protein
LYTQGEVVFGFLVSKDASAIENAEASISENQFGSSILS